MDEVAALTPGEGEVAIRVAYVGICGTDLHIFHGNMDQRVSTPHIMGHEMSGTIESVGAGVTADFAEGDRVTVMPLSWDDSCPTCRNGHPTICENLNFLGIDSAGALQETWIVPADTVIALPAKLDLAVGALVEPTAVAVHDVRRGSVVAGEKVLIIGGGPIGILIASVASDSGADVRLLELDTGRAQEITNLGYVCYDPRDASHTEDIAAWTESAGVDIVFEVSGAAGAVASVTSYPKARGRIVIVAIHPTPREVNLQQVFWKELTLFGARVYERRDYDKAISLLAAGRIPSDTLISEVVPLERTSEAFAKLEKGQGLKILVRVQQGEK